MTRDEITSIDDRFRGFLPVVVDLETGGFTPHTDAILELAGTLIQMSSDGYLSISDTYSFNIKPFDGANIEASSLEFTGIDPDHPFRGAVDEKTALSDFFQIIKKEIRNNGCTRAILVGHNAHFDAAFLNAAVTRCNIKKNPFHPFTYFDTATLAGLAYGQTVLAKACQEANIDFDNSRAHSALYDAERTALLFCKIVNRWRELEYEYNKDF